MSDEEYGKFPEDGYHGDDIKELAKAFRAEYGDSFGEKDVAERHEVMARFGLERNIPKMQADLRRYGIEYAWKFVIS